MSRAPAQVAGLLRTALIHQQAGRAAEAERVCQLILSLDPGHPQTLHLLGLIEHQQGRSEDAIEHIRAAIARDARDAAFHHNLGNILLARDRSAEALECYDRALALAPNSVDSLYNLGNAYQQLGQPQGAIAHFERALRLRPEVVELYNNLGTALHDVGRFEEAIACYRKGLALAPKTLELLDNLTGALRARSLLDEAQACCERALALMPDRIESHIGLGAVLQDRGRREDALSCYERALALAPGHPAVCNNFGVLLVQLDRPAEAIAHYQRALATQPDQAETHNNLGIALEYLGRYSEALACYERALALKPDYADAHFNRAHALLITGNFEEGWREYEWRFAVAKHERNFGQPLWSGEPLDAQTILIQSEQGFGDTLQFVRYIPMVAERGGRVVIEVPQPLVRLIHNVPGITEIIAAGDPLPRFDWHCPLLSLPRVFKTGIANIPAPVPYLAADAERIAAWRERLPNAGLRIGISWQGNPSAAADWARSVPLRYSAPIAALPGVRLVSLQKHDGVEQLELLPSGMQVETLGPDLDAGPDAFLDTAAVMMSLDLVISCDTAIAHLAGALGRPVWLLLPHNPDWRWLAGREDTPWYPTARLFRQTQPGDWSGVIAKVAEAIAKQVS